MHTSIPSRRLPAALALIALSLVGLVLAAATNAAAGQSESAPANHSKERLVVRGEGTVKDAPCNAGVCPLEVTDGAFRGTPVGTGAYNTTVALEVAETFSNGEDGVCAPFDGRLVLGAGSADRLVLALLGDSCQDGAGDVRAASFTGLAHFTVKKGTGAYAKASGTGLASFVEDGSDKERMTLIGSISR